MKYEFKFHDFSVGGADTARVESLLIEHIGSVDGSDIDADKARKEIQENFLEVWSISAGGVINGVILVAQGVKNNKRGQRTFLHCMGLEYEGGIAPGLGKVASDWLKAEAEKRGLNFVRITGRMGWQKILQGEGYDITAVQMDFGDYV